MNRSALLSLLVILSTAAHAKKVVEPCHIRSRQMTLVKNCYTGEMAKPTEGGSQFFSFLGVKNSQANYCYNSLVTVQHKSTDPQIHIRVLRDDKKGAFQAYHYSIPRDELKKSKSDTPVVTLQGLKGECFSNNPDACDAGILQTLGFADSDVPMVLAIGKAGGQFILSHLVNNHDDIERLMPKELPGKVENDPGRAALQLIQEIRQKIVTVARAKTSAMRAGASPKKLAATSEQFRYCSMALEGFLKDKKMTDPFSAEEKMTLAALINYMNSDTGVPTPATANSRLPASKR
jgi:hypothetical protein